ncbi:toxin-antitoxin system HicB family antitoxin [Pantoea sp. 18069]|uniref:toxin-antitoxin system HicB family antitoxin n=1 Tax=Pantoea sp. 18069 TaxID=2681415 RepID=UPI001357F582|nr:toxin-antitoxin system HicB family antitoxin [Pantoea sp. 18069]
MNDDDRYTRITLRIPKDLHQKLGSAADETSKSLNAEIVGRLQGSLEAPEGEALKSLYKDLELARLTAHKERNDGLGAKLLAAQLVDLVDPEKLAAKPSLAGAAMSIKAQEREIMLDMMEHSILGLTQIPGLIERGLKQGNLTLVPDDQPTTWAKAPAAIKSQSSNLLSVLKTMGDDFALELFSREKVRAAFNRLEGVMKSDDAPSS